MKKLITIIVAAAMLFSMAVISFAAYDYSFGQKFINDPTFTLGDINDDGAVNARDSFLLKTSLAGVTEERINTQSADFDANGEIAPRDAYNLKICLAGVKGVDDFENGKQVYKLTIGSNELSKYTIVLNEGITDENNSYLAYLNLNKYLEQVTGHSLPLAYGEAITEKGIYINEMELDSQRGKELGVEGYKYEVQNGNLYIEGTYRGTMYAVYEIVEEYLGVRFLSDSETFVYKARCIDIPEGTVKEYVPPIVFRHACQSYENDLNKPLWHYFAQKLNATQLYSYSGKRFGTLTGPLYSNAHSFYEYWKMGTGTYPENTEGMTEAKIIEAKFASGTFPSQFDWQPCATDDDIYELLFEGMLLCNKMSMNWGNPNHYKEGITVMSFSILDNNMYCQCRSCKQISKTEGFSGLYLQMYNRAAVDVQEYYPGIRLYGIVYAKDFPSEIKPDDNLVLIYCGVSCDNHILGMEKCFEKGGQLNGMNNDKDYEALKFWGGLCKETGAELWFWIYPVNYSFYLCDTPNIPNLYYNVKFLVDECNVNGIYFEGIYPESIGGTYIFERLKAYVVPKLMWDPTMSYEEYCDIVKEYLFMYFGDGYEELFTYIEMMTEAGNATNTCFINNFDRPGDMFSYEYLAEHYYEMRGLLEAAYEKAGSDEQRERVENVIICCDFMGLSSLHSEMYVNGDTESVKEFTERYEWMYNKIIENDIKIFGDTLYTVPDVCDPELNPMIQFYAYGSRRPGVYP